MKKTHNVLLIGGGTVNMLISALHVAMLFVGASAFRFFGAPDFIVEHSDSLYVILSVLLLAALFFLAGCYALSGAGITRRLPATETVLLFIACLYIARGAVVVLLPFPELTQQLLTRYPGLTGMDRPLMSQDWFFSFASLLVGLAYFFGWLSIRRKG